MDSIRDFLNKGTSGIAKDVLAGLGNSTQGAINRGVLTPAISGIKNILNRNKPVEVQSTTQELDFTPMNSSTPITPTSPVQSPYTSPTVSSAPITTSQNMYPGGVSREDLAHTANVLSNARMQTKNTDVFDISKYNENVNSMNPTLTDLYAMRNQLTKNMNDIATGVVDPYKIAERYGVTFSPENQAAINRAIASIYDPIMSDLDARILSGENTQKLENSASNKHRVEGVLSGFSDSAAKEVQNYIKQEYEQHKLVQKFQGEVQALNSILSIDAETANGPQKQAIITDFAKYLDPDSVVREAEFDITRKYGQSEAERIGGEIRRWFDPAKKDAVLSAKAIEALQTAAQVRFESNQSQLQKRIREVANQLRLRYGEGPQYELLFADFSPVSTNLSGGEQSSQNGFTQLPNGIYINEQLLNAGIDAADRVKGAVATVESQGSGGYNARGPVIQSGMYKGERAMGKYQVMPGNLPEWSKQALGRVVSEQEFMSSPEIQEAIVTDQFIRNYQKYGNWNDVISVWFTGRPVNKQSMAASDGNLSGAQYVSKVNQSFT